MRRLSESVGGPAIAEQFRRNLLDPAGARQAAGVKPRKIRPTNKL